MKRKPVAIDTKALAALPVRLAEYRSLRIIQVGCGGSGSHLARMTAACAAALRDRGESVDLVFCDPDTVEAKNVPRQLFAVSDIGCPKAAVLAERYASAWGLAASADTSPFSSANNDVWNGYDRRVTVLVGAVDNAAARREMAKACEANREGALPSIWWIDAGNAADSGQVLVGTDTKSRNLRGSVQLGAVWRLPAPTLVAANLQSQTVNAWAATVAGDTLYRLVVSRNLARFGTWFDARSASVRSVPTAPSEIARAAGCRESALLPRKPRARAA